MEGRTKSYTFKISPIFPLNPVCCLDFVRLTIKDEYGKMILETNVKREDYSVFDLYMNYSTRLIGEPAPQID